MGDGNLLSACPRVIRIYSVLCFLGHFKAFAFSVFRPLSLNVLNLCVSLDWALPFSDSPLFPELAVL